MMCCRKRKGISHFPAAHFRFFERTTYPLISFFVDGQGWTWTSKSQTGNGVTVRDDTNYATTYPYGAARGIRTLKTALLRRRCMPIPFTAAYLVAPAGVEPTIPDWKSDVLTAWPRGHFCAAKEIRTLKTTILSRSCMPIPFIAAFFWREVQDSNSPW